MPNQQPIIDVAPTMVRIAGGPFWMGSDDHYAEERPRRQVDVAPFLIDVAPVTNRQFRAFVKTTGYRTLAERKPDPADYPDADPKLLRAGSAVFVGTRAPVPVVDPTLWWAYLPGANWRRPEGPKSTVAGREEHPVVHVAHEDAAAYAAWCGKRLPTEAEWECAARGGIDGAVYAWGDELAPGAVQMANYWQGDFPWRRDRTFGWRTTSPVGAFPANAFGLYDMIGNVWEWTDDWYDTNPDESCCVSSNARENSRNSGTASGFGRKVLKGGSHLCAESYCRRYRPAARHPQNIDTSTSHIGFRCVRNVDR
jgi:sulfatase modifying factor 1